MSEINMCEDRVSERGLIGQVVGTVKYFIEFEDSMKPFGKMFKVRLGGSIFKDGKHLFHEFNCNAEYSGGFENIVIIIEKIRRFVVEKLVNEYNIYNKVSNRGGIPKQIYDIYKYIIENTDNFVDNLIVFGRYTVGLGSFAHDPDPLFSILMFHILLDVLNLFVERVKEILKEKSNATNKTKVEFSRRICEFVESLGSKVDLQDYLINKVEIEELIEKGPFILFEKERAKKANTIFEHPSIVTPIAAIT